MPAIAAPAQWGPDMAPMHPAIIHHRRNRRRLRPRMVVLVDRKTARNEGDLVMAAEHITPEAINFMARTAAA